VLIVVFNYITACMCMLGLQASDPFHFGTLPRAMVFHLASIKFRSLVCVSAFHFIRSLPIPTSSN
jgi:hypothetical protein